MTLLKVLTTVGGKEAADNGDDLARAVWDVFNECFTEMHMVAIQDHTMNRPKFDAMMADTGVEKLVSIDDDGAVVGLTTVTTDLTAVPLINPLFFDRWPHLNGRIFYVQFIGVLPRAGVGPLMQVVDYVGHRAAAAKGAVSFDACMYNNDVLKFTRRLVLAARMIARDDDEFPNPVHQTIDVQSYELVDLSGVAQ